MPDIKEIASDSSYDAQATAASKTAIFTFFATFLYMVFASGVSPGLIGGAIFFVVGIFVVSIAIAMPLLLLSKKIPSIGWLFSIIDVVITILVTRYVYLWIFS